MSGEPTTGDGAAGDEDAAGSVGDAAPAPRRRSRVATLVRGVFFVAGVAFLVLTVARTWPEITDVIAGHTPAVIGAGVLAAGSVVAFAQAWVAMFPGSHRARVAASFYIGQLAKYIPGGMLGIVGQVAFMRDAGVPLRHAATAFVVFAFTLVVGSMMSAFPLVLDADVPTILRLAGVGGLATVVLAWRPWFVTALSLVSRVLRRPVVPPSTIADQRQITLSVVWSLGGAVASGLAFAVAADLVAEVPPLTAMAAFGLAWAVGFVAVPLPAGLGLREA
ncbi:MAG: hypothetical protein S0880_07845, partial [Actinomycetota bacterium]|nr:hypothetical protein [Actinomycetota bacterium]